MKSNKLLAIVILLPLLLLLSCTCNTTKTIIIDDKDDYIECVDNGIESFRYKHDGFASEKRTTMFNNSFKEYYTVIIKNCKELYQNNK